MKNVCLVVVDGLGISRKKDEKDATKPAKFLTDRKEGNLYFHLKAAGKYVGLPDGMVGNSEVGHMTLGAGRATLQSLKLINDKIKNGEFVKRIAELVPSFSEQIHLIGLISDGGVHSHIEHLKFLLKAIPKNKKISIHAISDGRDSGPCKLKEYLKQIPEPASITGRYFAMDRDGNEDRTERAYQMLTEGRPGSFNLDDLYRDSITDEFIPPIMIKNEPIKKGDTIILFNYRADRMRQIFTRLVKLGNLITMTDYGLEGAAAIFKLEKLKNTLAEVISKVSGTQSHIAETEKYAHVTYFFNGRHEEVFGNEERILVKSPYVKRMDEEPGTAMSGVALETYEAMARGRNFIVANLAGPDLIGHTGMADKTEKAVEIVNGLVEKLAEAAVALDYVLLITSDHGNAEEMTTNGECSKKHTNNETPLVIINSKRKQLTEKGELADVAPTILDIMGINIPKEMKGKSLVASIHE